MRCGCVVFCHVFPTPLALWEAYVQGHCMRHRAELLRCRGLAVQLGRGKPRSASGAELNTKQGCWSVQPSRQNAYLAICPRRRWWQSSERLVLPGVNNSGCVHSNNFQISARWMRDGKNKGHCCGALDLKGKKCDFVVSQIWNVLMVP